MDSQKPSRDEAILTSVAESIGSTLGTIAAKADAVQKVFTKKVSGAKPRARRAAKRAVKSMKKRTRPRMKRVRKGRAAAAARRTRRKL